MSYTLLIDQLLAKQQKPLRLIQDVKTRLNSSYMSIQRFLVLFIYIKQTIMEQADLKYYKYLFSEKATQTSNFSQICYFFWFLLHHLLDKNQRCQIMNLLLKPKYDSLFMIFTFSKNFSKLSKFWKNIRFLNESSYLSLCFFLYQRIFVIFLIK